VEHLAIACSTARALPSVRRWVCVEKNSAIPIFECPPLRALSPLPGATQQHRLIETFSLPFSTQDHHYNKCDKYYEAYQNIACVSFAGFGWCCVSTLQRANPKKLDSATHQGNEHPLYEII
jgi:hypothetical protein